MRIQYGSIGRTTLCLTTALLVCAMLDSGCGGGSSYLQLVSGRTLFSNYTGSSASTSGSGSSGSYFNTGSRGAVDPCEETTNRKYIRISMRNLATDYVHYFLVLIAYVNGDTYTDGAVCADDIKLYTDFGYTEIPEEAELTFGNYCIRGPALLYFHKGGQFRGGGTGTGNSSLGSAIGPASGSSATYDNFFTSSGARVPVPNQILFHNPGTGEGAALQVYFYATDPCNDITNFSLNSDCDLDSFYYVDETDLMTGSTALGTGSGLRTPSEIQGTGCECSGFEDSYQTLAPSGTSASAARCYEFLRGGRIEYVFFREDTNPPFPQLIWRVTDQNGATVHDFDSSAPTP